MSPLSGCVLHALTLARALFGSVCVAKFNTNKQSHTHTHSDVVFDLHHNLTSLHSNHFLVVSTTLVHAQTYPYTYRIIHHTPVTFESKQSDVHITIRYHRELEGISRYIYFYRQTKPLGDALTNSSAIFQTTVVSIEYF